MSLRTKKARRNENKTNYKLRIGLLKSDLNRIVIRRTNRYLTIQIVKSEEAQDSIVTGISSKELLEYGWDKKFAGSLKSIPAAYLAGYLLAKKVKKGEFILDLGLAIKHKGGRIYAVASGLKDGGLNIRVGESVLPDEKRLMGEHVKPEVKAMLTKVKANIK
jgi:large subunit ribosomal protein L18